MVDVGVIIVCCGRGDRVTNANASENVRLNRRLKDSQMKSSPLCNGSVFFFLSNLQLDYILSYRT